MTTSDASLRRRAKSMLAEAERLLTGEPTTWDEAVARARREYELGLYTMVRVHSPWTEAHYERRETKLGRIVREMLVAKLSAEART